MDMRTYKIMGISVLWYKPKFQSVSQVFKAVASASRQSPAEKARWLTEGYMSAYCT